MGARWTSTHEWSQERRRREHRTEPLDVEAAVASRRLSPEAVQAACVDLRVDLVQLVARDREGAPRPLRVRRRLEMLERSVALLLDKRRR